MSAAALLSGATASAHGARYAWPAVTPVVCVARGSSALEILAAREAQRYLYVRTGRLPFIRCGAIEGPAVIVASKARPMALAFARSAGCLAEVRALHPGEFVVWTVKKPRATRVLLCGGDGVGTLYAAYRFAEALGVRFALDGDIIPDEPLRGGLPYVHEAAKPLFSLRGIQPFHDFPEGPDWWNLDDYRAVETQMVKLRMNFIGLHTYPEPIAEPTVWIGMGSDAGCSGTVSFAYPASYQNTLRGDWGYSAKPTSSFLFGASQLFDRDDFGADVMKGLCPKPATPAACCELFNRTGAMLRGAFEWARRFSIRTCVGTETPLTIPATVKARLAATGHQLDDPQTVEFVYEGLFRRIMGAYPIDYYWFWTPEGWTWEGAKPQQVAATQRDLTQAVAAARAVRAPFRLATCGWVLGPPEDPAAFDKWLPKSIAMSCINRNVGNSPVDPAFARINGREKWAIPWMEDDPGLTAPQLWVGRMRRDAADALKYGCNGLMGIHWRTRVIGPNVMALAQAAWTQAPWSKQLQPALRYAPAGDFWMDWAQAEFGQTVARQAAQIFARIDCSTPRPVNWIGGPGGLAPDDKPWEQVQAQYGFVKELERLRARVHGPRSRERFDYWLNTFRYTRAVAYTACVWAKLNRALERAEAQKEPSARQRVARNEALPLRVELVRAVREVYRYLLQLVGTTGELGTVANWEQHILPGLLGSSGERLEKALGEDLPAAAEPDKSYRGAERVFVVTRRSVVQEGEALDVRVVALSPRSPISGVLMWRPLGRGPFHCVRLKSVARGVFHAVLPAAATKGSLEYYVQVMDADRRRPVRYPAGAPSVTETVAVMPAGK
ncbi:MAG: hypothetical protein ACP5VE_06905 [Chthonomonadales bacterium]